MDKIESYITDDHKDMIDQFRLDLKDYLNRRKYSDAEILRWLRAKNFILKKAEQNFREVYWNRITYGINNFVNEFEIPEVLQKYRGDTFLGYAKDGSPIRYIKFNVDFYGFLLSISTYHLVLYFCYLMELDIKAQDDRFKKTGERVEGITYILDMEGMSIQNLGYKAVIEQGLDSMRLYQDHYPESWRNLLFVNAPFIFGKVLSIFKPILQDSFLGKLRAVSKENTPALLREYVDEDVLPAFLGGKRVDSKGDPFCKEFVNQAGIIPEKYYLKNSTHLIQETDPGVKVVTVPARSVYNVNLVMREGSGKYRVEQRTENGSIVVSVFYREFNPDPEHTEMPSSDEYLDPHDKKCNVKMVGTRLRSQSHLAPNDGYGIAAHPGVYIIQFDNMDSWFTSRKLFYRITFSKIDTLPEFGKKY